MPTQTRVKTRPHPGATIVDMIVQMKLKLRKNPDTLILHCQMNEIENSVDTVKV